MMNRTYLQPGRLGFVVLTVTFLVNAVTLYFAERSFVEVNNAVTAARHTQDILVTLGGVVGEIVRAESLQRGYLITLEPGYRAGYAESVAGVRRKVGELERLVHENPVQVVQMETVRSMARNRIQLMDEAIERRDRDGFAGAAQHVLEGRGKFAMDALQLSLAGMEAEERVQLERRDANLQVNLAQVRRGAVVASALNLMLIALGASFLVMELRRRKLEQAEASRRAGELELVVAERTSQLSGLSQFLQRFQEEEKARIAHDLHDELGGTLAAAKIDLEMLSAKLPAGHGQEERVARLVLAIDDAVHVKRRLIEDLRPTILDNLGIAAALRWQCDQFSKRSGRPCQVEIEEGDLAMPVDHGIAFYRIVQEGLTNVSKYANAQHVAVLLRREAGQWVLQVSDDGVGFDPAKKRNHTAHGLLSMRERARALGGDLSIESTPGRGTVLRVRVPMHAPPAPGNSAPVGAA